MTASTHAAPSLSEAGRGRAVARVRLLRPSLEEGVPLARVAREQGVSLRTTQRWAARYRREGLAGLAHRSRADRGHPRLPPALRDLIEGLALQRPRRSSAAIQRQVAAVARQHGWPVPSYKQVYRLVRALDPALATLAHGGEQAYRERYDLILRRETDRVLATNAACLTRCVGRYGAGRPGPAPRGLVPRADPGSQAVAWASLGRGPGAAGPG